MLSWVRGKLAEGRLRWQQSLIQQRNSTSPPPLPAPNLSESPASTPIRSQSTFASSNESFQHHQQHQQHHYHHHQQQETTIQIANQRPNAHLTLEVQENTHGIKSNGNNRKHYSQILRKDQRYDSAFGSSQYDQPWSTNASFSQTSTSIVINRRANDSTVPYVNLRIFNCVGSKCTICAPLSLTFADVKRKVMAEFHARRQLFTTPFVTKSNCMPGSSRNSTEEQKMSCDNLDLVQLSRHYKLARISRLHEDFDEHSSLATANVQNNEEMLLVLCSGDAATCVLDPKTKDATTTVASVSKHSSNPSTLNSSKHHLNFNSEDDSEGEDNDSTNSALPTQFHIDMATEHLEAKNIRGPNVVNIDELVLTSDVQYDIRKILISLANACAYVIGAGAHATRIISMLKQRLIQRKQHEQDTKQCLIEMGFNQSKVQHALNINNNIYAAALEWLIENQSPTNPLLSEEMSPAMSLSSKFTNNVTIKDNVESLLEIVRIYCQQDLPPPSEMVQFIVSMGFDEATAREALKITKNHQSNACEWLVGDRSKINQFEQNDGLPSESPILCALLNSPHIQLSLSNPKIFIAYLSILEDYSTMSMWLNDNETSGIINQVLRCYHEERHIMAINQFSQK